MFEFGKVCWSVCDLFRMDDFLLKEYKYVKIHWNFFNVNTWEKNIIRKLILMCADENDSTISSSKLTLTSLSSNTESDLVDFYTQYNLCSLTVNIHLSLKDNIWECSCSMTHVAHGNSKNIVIRQTSMKTNNAQFY